LKEELDLKTVADSYAPFSEVNNNCARFAMAYAAQGNVAAVADGMSLRHC